MTVKLKRTSSVSGYVVALSSRLSVCDHFVSVFGHLFLFQVIFQVFVVILCLFWVFSQTFVILVCLFLVFAIILCLFFGHLVSIFGHY